MKKKLFLGLIAAGLLLCSACSLTSFRRLYTLCNQTEKEITLYPYGTNDSVILAPKDVFILDAVLVQTHENVVPSLNSGRPLYLKMDNVMYMVDKNAEGNCLSEDSYQRASEAYEESVRQSDKDQVLVFYLTEDYITRQIVVTEE